MTQTYQMISKENNASPLSELLFDQGVIQFMRSVIAQELNLVSEKLQDPALLSATFETIKSVLRTSRAAELTATLQSKFTGKK
ncbi:MAG: hypothetical protein GW762_03290 [Candidatus Pacebacteria bacterium]|nr:hypothetical protein [Candidatus Paceibacterota bacterium]PIR63526.1 MAG: hypothetical protein COU64_04060 [Candidatus Pacebacteria bacterium CG10_big_fil_rev_8_21_14_0_10_40_26]PIZ79411.1 MAG: hypothetical protein COY01_01020 [Candidatus Pacebacteria bacterium CG_4_10_14_0_2_um_filter_40_20]PJA68560.1 MAG: hypothetical protein CO156_04690 [Candidatus Pacebacteria bacterium CG_4_9_14_3_um_filter_40_12]PJC41944.1 MAG: hypothetical protein CO041_01945 [Candidatus Pacebacteria bacterium CG_4_9_